MRDADYAVPTWALEFLEAVPWRWVQQKPAGVGAHPEKSPDPHQYVIRGWDTVPTAAFDAFARLIRQRGYRARYTPPYHSPEKEYVGRYLEVGEWVYWHIWPHQLCRTKIEFHQAERIAEQIELFQARLES